MGEDVIYDIHAKGFSSEDERTSFMELCRVRCTGTHGKFGRRPGLQVRYVTWIYMRYWDSFPANARESFGQWLSEHPHVTVKFFCKYTDYDLNHYPTEIIAFADGQWKHIGFFGFRDFLLPKHSSKLRRPVTGGDNAQRFNDDAGLDSSDEQCDAVAESPTELPTFKGYTVDLRLRQFRLVDRQKPSIEFIPFSSEKGRKLLAEMGAGWLAFEGF